MNDQIDVVAAECAARLGLDLEAVEVTGPRSRRLLRVVVDADGGVDVDTIAAVTRAVSAALDAADVMGERPYTLEVTSRGLDRPLTSPRHWRRNLGRLVAVRTGGGERFIGRIVAGDDPPTTVRLAVDGQERALGLHEIAEARIEPELKKRGG